MAGHRAGSWPSASQAGHNRRQNIDPEGVGSVSDRYYEDFKVGERFVSGGMTMTEAGIIEFARQWDPQPFHIDVEFARKWTFGGLIASGLHTMCVTLKLWLELGVMKNSSLGSPGLGETQFPRPEIGRAHV